LELGALTCAGEPQPDSLRLGRNSQGRPHFPQGATYGLHFPEMALGERVRPAREGMGREAAGQLILSRHGTEDCVLATVERRPG